MVHATNDDVDTTINDNDSALVSITPTTNASEPSTNGLFTVSISNNSESATTIAYTVTGTATATDDYTALSGSVTIPANTASATIDVTVADGHILDIELAKSRLVAPYEGIVADRYEQHGAVVNPGTPIVLQTIGTVGSQLTIQGGPVDMGVNIGGESECNVAMETGDETYLICDDTTSYSTTAWRSEVRVIRADGSEERLGGAGYAYPDEDPNNPGQPFLCGDTNVDGNQLAQMLRGAFSWGRQASMYRKIFWPSP